MTVDWHKEEQASSHSLCLTVELPVLSSLLAFKIILVDCLSEIFLQPKLSNQERLSTEGRCCGVTSNRLWFVRFAVFDTGRRLLLVDTGDPNQHMVVAGEFGRHRLYKMLGYFSLVGLLRLHSLLGDYHQALRVIENMNVNRKVVSKYP